MDYENAIEYLYNLKIYGMSLGLERIEYLLEALDSPHKELKAIHVAGTNGKGSVCAMISSILDSAGYKVGLFTSPHLISFEERIMIGGKKIPKDKVCSQVQRIKTVAEDMASSGKFEHPTYFEVVTAMGFSHFKEENVDYAVLEVGLGGRLDATNVITPLVSVITTVALDHMHVLGNSLSEVAREKAGIIKPDVPVITGIADEDILKIITEICKQKDCELYTSKEHVVCTLKEASLDSQVFDLELKGFDARYDDLRIPLLGRHQLQNSQIAALAVSVLKKGSVHIPEKSIYEGFENTRWPGRLEIASKNPPIILDCAHNPAGARALKASIKGLFTGKRLTMIIGIMRDKDIPGIIKELAPLADNIIITKPDIDRVALPKTLKSEAEKYCTDVMVKEKVAEAVEHALKNSSEQDVICITGSIFNVGEARSKLAEMGIDP